MRQFKPTNGFEPPLLTAEIGYALGKEGKTGESERGIVDLQGESKLMFVDPYLVSLINLGMGDEHLTLQWLNRAPCGAVAVPDFDCDRAEVEADD
jgi:hypothetical protein